MNRSQGLYLRFGMMAWLLFVSLAYVYTHKAISPQMLLAIIKNIWVLILAVLFLSLSGGLGCKILTFFSHHYPAGQLHLGEDWDDDEPFFAIAIGLGISSLFILLVGGLIGATAWVFGLLAFVLAVWLWRDVGKFWMQVGRVWLRLSPVQVVEKVLAFFSALVILLNLSVALAPPLAFDALVYHLTLPLRYLQVGQIVYNPEIMFWGMPQQAEMAYLFVLAIGRESAPAVLTWSLGLLTMLGLAGHLNRTFDRLTAWFAVTTVLSGFTFSRLLGLAYAEWFLLFYALVWWQVLRRTLLPGAGRGWLILLSVVAGFALSLKYTAGTLVLLTILALFLRGRSWKENLADILLFGSVVTVVSLPWWVKNFVWTGNPFYPLLFPAGAMDSIRYDFYHNIPSSLTLLQALGFPWYITVWGVDGKLGPSASIGPLLLAFWPLAYLDWRTWTKEQQRLIGLATLLLLAGFALWVVAGSQNNLLVQTRLFIVIFLPWIFLASAGFQATLRIRLASIRLGRIALTIVFMFLAFNVFETFSDVLPMRTIEANFGLFSRENYLTHNLGGLYSASEIIQQLPNESRVVMLWETRSFYCVPRCDSDEIIDRWYHEARLHNTTAEIRTAWLEQGYTHMLIWESGFEFVRDFDNAKFNQRDWLLLKELREMLGPGQQIGDYTLYPLR